ncbi:MAG: NUDIX domain-containing protein [Nanoarchaeota archaeon]
MIDNELETRIGTFAFLRSEGKTLMLHRNKDPSDFLYGKFVAPGGKFKPRETPQECAVREYKEETNLTLGNVFYKGWIFFDNAKRNFQGKPAKFNFLVYIFEATSYTGNMKHPKEGDLIWVPEEKLTDLEMEKGDAFIIKRAVEGKPLHHRIILSDTDAVMEELPKEEYDQYYIR